MFVFICLLVVLILFGVSLLIIEPFVVEHPKDECPACSGSGDANLYYDVMWDGDRVFPYLKCKRCNGTGVVEEAFDEEPVDPLFSQVEQSMGIAEGMSRINKKRNEGKTRD